MFDLPRIARRIATVISGLSLATVLVPAAVLAAPPTTQALNPEPPDFYTCKPVGSGTICRALTSDPYGPDATGIFCGAAELLDQGTRTIAATRYYDADGNLTRRVRVFDFDDTRLTNSLTGVSLAYHQHNTDWEVLAVPGDLSSATLHGHGEMIVTAPGFGDVFHGAGLTVIGPDGSLLHRGGRDEVSDYYNGDSSIIGDLCAALAG